ncbi:MAG: copper resistance protein CopC [Armatimonadetes bacterium]|nr:copper resistance protein CopC [Armatimonadota bacterium]
MGTPAQGKILTVLVAVTAAMAGAAVPAMAHATLERSDPPANRLLLKPPAEVVLHFSEPVDPQRTEIKVLDQEGRRVDRPGFQASSDRRRARVPVQSLGPGIYTVTWRTLSIVDHHTYEGFFTFTLGPIRPGAFSLQAGVPSEPWPAEVAARWLVFMGAAVLIGGLVVDRFFVSSLASTQLVEAGEAWLTAVHRRWRIAAGLAAAAAAAGTTAELTFQAVRTAAAAGGGFGTALASLAGGEPARTSLLLRIAIPIVLLVSLRRPAPGLTPRPAARAVGRVSLPAMLGLSQLLLAALLPLGITLTSHAAATPALLPFLADWLHLLSAAVWVGGLIFLAAVLEPGVRSMDADDRARFLGSLVPRFSNLAVASVAVLVATGAYAAWVNIPGLESVRTTAYGRALAIKIALLLPLLGIAAVNLGVMRPRLATLARRGVAVPGSLPLAQRFFRLVHWEAGLAALVLVAAGALALLPTARQVQALAPSGTVTLARPVGDLEGVVRIDPYQVGENVFELRLQSGQGLPVSDARVRFAFRPLAVPMGTAAADAVPRGDGRFTLRGAYISTRGPWLITVTVRRRGMEDRDLLYVVEPGWERTPVPSTTSPTDATAMALLRQADAAMNRLRTLRQREDLADDSGNHVTTLLEFAAPNALRFRVLGGMEAIIIGDVHFSREGGAWQRSQSPSSLTFPNFAYGESTRHATLGPRELVDGARTQVVVFTVTLARASARYAVWIEEKSHRILRVAMVAPAHYMISHNYDFDAPLQIQVPPGGGNPGK